MNNNTVETMLNDCQDDLVRVEHLILGLGTSPVINYLIKYAVIRTCGTIEQSYKTIIADYYETLSPALAQFISIHVRETSKNPSFQVIKGQLKEFDNAKADTYSMTINSLPDNNRIIASLDSLRTLRNDIAHGSNITCGIADVKSYFADSRILIEELDGIML